jgi:pimeloyl-ACP methyl ester carboxylesterase
MHRRAALLGMSGLALAGCVQAPDPFPVAGVKLRMIRSNGISMRIAEAGSGPLVLLVHGWPESWYSWRHQLPALAAAGYRAVAPDMRGYGSTDKPAAISDYDIAHLSGDLVGILDALGETSAVLVGHDWGAIVSWNTILLHPTRFSAIAGLSVPYNGRGPAPPIDGMRRTNGENFFYILYFQEPGVAEAEFDANPRGILSRLYRSPDSPTEAPTITDPKMSAGGWIGRMGALTEQPAWLTPADLDYYVNEFTRAGFRGGINYYRNFNRNWEITPQLTGAQITQPAMFLAGEKDTVIRGATREALETNMKRTMTDLRGVTLVPGAGHWVQQEKPAEVNTALLGFLKSL